MNFVFKNEKTSKTGNSLFKNEEFCIKNDESCSPVGVYELVRADAIRFVYTCRRLIDLSLLYAVCFVYTCRRLIDLFLIAGTRSG